MSNIKVQQVDENEVEVTLSPETPMEMVAQLTKGLNARGLVEDLAKSTVSIRYFYRPTDPTSQMADKLIKSLEKMAGDNPYSKDARRQTSERNRINDRRARAGMSSLTDNDIAAKRPAAQNTALKPETNTAPAALPHMTPSSGPATLPPNSNKLHNPSLSGTVNYKKSEHPDSCSCRECKATRKAMEVKKSERKLNWNQGDLDRVATNFARAMSDKLVKGTEVAGKLNEMYKTKTKLQPTDQELFGHLEVTEEMAKKAQDGYHNQINNFFAEASKPISSRFASPEEERAYWDSIKVDGSRDDGQPGY